ncbi:MAG TPA: substrate-binding domain-containing protein, partial [Thermoclostridium sp.]|nr:substrate-binding domain-containing protein [Thermoclostridium sp.]
TAIFCLNDLMAAGVYNYFYEQGIDVGNDISLVGYDNKEISEYLRPALTTNDIQFKKIGAESAKMILEILENNRDESISQNVIKIPCQLMIRDSVKKI